MDQDATWYGGSCLVSGHIVLDEDPAPPPPDLLDKENCSLINYTHVGIGKFCSSKTDNVKTRLSVNAIRSVMFTRCDRSLRPIASCKHRVNDSSDDGMDS